MLSERRKHQGTSSQRDFSAATCSFHFAVSLHCTCMSVKRFLVREIHNRCCPHFLWFIDETCPDIVI